MFGDDFFLLLWRESKKKKTKKKKEFWMIRVLFENIKFNSAYFIYLFIFLSQVPTSLKILDREAIWLQPLPLPIPTVPAWDAMRRRYHDEVMRKDASTSTDPSLNETTERISGQGREDEGMPS